jgi:hypothetical protein
MVDPHLSVANRIGGMLPFNIRTRPVLSSIPTAILEYGAA